MNNYSPLLQQTKTEQRTSDNPTLKAVSLDSQGSSSYKGSTNYSKLPPQTRNTPNFLSFNSNTLEPKRPNDNETMANVLLYCLKSQSQIASAVTDIGNYLKQLNEDSNNLSYFQRKPALPTTSTASLSYRNSHSNQNYKPSAESLLQPILAKLDLIQSEIQFKLKEFERQTQSTAFLTSFNVPNRLIHDDNAVKASSNHNFSPQTQKSLSRSKQSTENLLLRNSIGQLLPTNSEKTKTPLTKGNICDAASEVLDETPNMSRYYEISSTENSRMFQNEIPGSIGETHRLSNNVGRKSSSRTNKMSLLGNSQVKLLPKGSAQKSNGKASANNKSGIGQGNKKVLVPAIKLEMLLDPKPQGQAEPSKKASQLNIELLRKNLQNYGQSKTTIRRDTRANIGTIQTSRAEHQCEASEVEYMSAKNSARDVLLEAGRPFLTVLPRKEIEDDSLEHGGEQTALLDKSMQSTDEQALAHNPNQLEELQWSQSSHSGFQNFDLILAKKEKVIIKTLMKDQYGEEQPSYHKADHGKIHQKKYLINAKWWRDWKEYVNFDSEDGPCLEKTISTYEIRQYPRPGPINNRELLRQDAITDLANLTPELELKDNLLEHHDYEAVSKKVYDVLVKWYGSDFEICRVLRPDPFHENRPYLELYPKKKPTKKPDAKSADSNTESNYVSVINNIITSNLKHKPIS